MGACHLGHGLWDFEGCKSIKSFFLYKENRVPFNLIFPEKQAGLEGKHKD
jgi:hypothetical protein